MRQSHCRETNGEIDAGLKTRAQNKIIHCRILSDAKQERIMNTYEFTQAFVNANDAVLNHVDAIEETRALSELIDACKERMAEIKPDAVELAQKVMAKNHVEGSEFEYKGKLYQLQEDETFEFAEKKAQYNDAIAAQWRAKAEEQKGLKASVSALTSEMKGLLKSWRLQHPKRVPDSVSYTFKVLKKAVRK